MRKEVNMAKLWADQIVDGKRTYSKVPRLLKEDVKEILIKAGLESLIIE